MSPSVWQRGSPAHVEGTANAALDAHEWSRRVCDWDTESHATSEDPPSIMIDRLYRVIRTGSLGRGRVSWKECAQEQPHWNHEDISQMMAPYRKLLSLKPGWDGDEAPVIDRRTWNRAADVLSVIVNALDRRSLRVTPPEIHPTRTGGLDLLWPRPEAFLVISVTSNDQPTHWVRRTRKGTLAHNVFDPASLEADVANHVKA